MSGQERVRISPERIGGGAVLGGLYDRFRGFFGIRLDKEHEHTQPETVGRFRGLSRGGHRARHRETCNAMAKRSRQINMRIRRGL